MEQGGTQTQAAIQHRARHFDRICLTGFMGSGKSTCGKLLAQRLSWNFTDLDLAITQEQQLSIADIFAQQGEAGFRAVEQRMLLRVLQQPRTVIALGGGSWLDAASRKAIREVAVTIWLDASAEDSWQRSESGADRPLRQDRKSFTGLLRARRPVYEQAEIAVRTKGKTQSAIVDEIANKLLGDEWLEV